MAGLMESTPIIQTNSGLMTQEPLRDKDPNRIFRQVLMENPGLSKVFSPENTEIIFALPDRIKSNPYSGQLEYWPADETGIPGFPHPTGGGKNVLEIYSKELQSNPQKLKNAIYGDLMHGMGNDPTWSALREEFKNNYTPEEKARIANKRSWWEDANSTEGSAPNSGHDAYIRGWMNERNITNEGRNSGNLSYSPEQIKILEKMERYLKEGK